MAGCAVWSRRFLGGLLILFLLAGGIVAWRERMTLLSWFYVRNLARASETNRPRWVNRAAKLGEAALPGLFDCLTQPDARVCANACAALAYMTHAWGNGDPRTADLALRLARELPRFSSTGQKQVLDLAAGWFRESARQPDSLLSACEHLLSELSPVAENDVLTSALELCGILLNQPGDSQESKPLDAAHKLVVAALQSTSMDNRLRAVRLSLHPGMADLLEQVAGLLGDESPQVRRAALIAVGAARDAVHDDQLLPCLHDPDAEVRRRGEQVLIARGLRPEYLELGRLLTDPQPGKRLQVLDRLRQSTELDSGLWLRRLSHDPAPSVRVAAMRAMTQQSFVDLSDRIDQIAREDASPTVRQLAQFYLTCPRRQGK
ncbi:MAG TPA: HEAT repeat domain-containing protein [Gemmataceae bacterium]|nr:HEAT repeat domain-containing protein [Gemmataceae bacterium]